MLNKIFEKSVNYSPHDIYYEVSSGNQFELTLTTPDGYSRKNFRKKGSARKILVTRQNLVIEEGNAPAPTTSIDFYDINGVLTNFVQVYEDVNGNKQYLDSRHPTKISQPLSEIRDLLYNSGLVSALPINQKDNLAMVREDLSFLLSIE